MLSEEQPEARRSLRRSRIERGQKLAQLAIAWALRDPAVTSVLIGASSVDAARREC